MRTVAIVQARMQSRRLPGKVLMPIAGKPLLAFLVDRIKAAASLDDLVVATGDVSANRPIVELAQASGLKIFVGSEDDVLDRFVQAARVHRADVVVRVTADNPLTDPGVVDALVAARAGAGADLAWSDRLIDGAGSEVTTREALARASSAATSQAHREHVTLIMKEQPARFSVVRWTPPLLLSRPDLSVTVDTLEEFEKVRALCEMRGPGTLAPAWPEMIRRLDTRLAQV